MAKNEKIFGYILLTIGVIFLVFSIVEMLMVYSGNSPPPNLIILQDISMPGDNGTSITLIQGNQINQIANLFFWFLLMLFVLFAGGKIASLGVNMVKDIKVEVKEPLFPPKEAKKKNQPEQTEPQTQPQAEPQVEAPEDRPFNT